MAITGFEIARDCFTDCLILDDIFGHDKTHVICAAGHCKLFWISHRHHLHSFIMTNSTKNDDKRLITAFKSITFHTGELMNNSVKSNESLQSNVFVK